jgi:Tetracyclin repressor-like, C-terminal domain
MAVERSVLGCHADVPTDTGGVADDVDPCRRRPATVGKRKRREHAHRRRLAGAIVGVLTFVFADYFNATGRPSSQIREQAVAGRGSIMAAIIERAVKRGEIDPHRLTPHIASLPVDLVRHDLIMNQAPVPDETLIEIVDHIFLPLVRRQP